MSPAHPSQRPPRGTHPLPLVPAQTPPRALTAVRPEPPRRARALKQPPAIGVLRAAKHVIERRSLDVFFILLLPVARPAASAASAAAAEPPRVRFPSRVVARLLLPAPSRALERQDVEIARDAPKGVARDGVAERARGASSRHGARGDEGPRRARPRGAVGREREAPSPRSLGAGAGLGGSPEGGGAEAGASRKAASRSARSASRSSAGPRRARSGAGAGGAAGRFDGAAALGGGALEAVCARLASEARPAPTPADERSRSRSSRSSSIARAADWTRPRRNDRANLTRRG